MPGRNLLSIGRSGFKILRQIGPSLSIGLGIGGMFVATIDGIRKTPKALALLEEAKKEKGDDFTKVDAVKACWKCYISTAAISVCSTACIIGGCHVKTRRHAALATAYSISEAALNEYRQKTREIVGEKKEKEIRDSIDHDHIVENPVSNNVVIDTRRGTTLCFDPWGGRYFYHDIEKLRKAENKFNRDLIGNDYGSLNDFYDLIGLTGSKFGDDIGWNINRCMMELVFSSQLSDVDDTPCLVLGFRVNPYYGYDKYEKSDRH